MAANCARRTLQISSASAKTLLNRTSSSPFASKASQLSELYGPKPTSVSRFAVQKLKFSRLPVELAGAQSLIPLHSATASALFTSLLSLHNCSWGCLSEGSWFAPKWSEVQTPFKVLQPHYNMASELLSRYKLDHE